METFQNLCLAQTARAEHLAHPEPAKPAPLSAREVALEGLRQRNVVLDGIFYDIGTLSDEESTRLAPVYAAEGAILLVGPSGAPSLQIFADVEALDASGLTPRALVVAGVGSSALGSAAFARNLADVIDAPVLAVVSGYGLSDVLNEAIGGYFLFGYLNSLRHAFEPLDDLFRATSGTGPGQESFGTGLIETTVRKSLDVRTLATLLASGRAFDLLVGHSKGNLVISEALYLLREEAPETLETLGQNTHVITVSAKIAMPRQMKRVTDVLGTLDNFGLLNSRSAIPTDVSVPMAWHHTNTELLFSLPVTKTLAPLVTAP